MIPSGETTSGGGTTNGFGAGTIYVTDCNPYIVSTTVVNNTNGIGAAIAFGNAANAHVQNCILYGNVATNYGNQLAIGLPNSDPFFDWNDIEGGLAGIQGGGSGANYTTANYSATNIMVPPQFQNQSTGVGNGYNPANYSWQLIFGSPCVNSGSTTGVINLLPALDLAGNPRINGAIDIGAYEYTIPVPAQVLVNNVTLGNGNYSCYNATQTITVAGNGTAFEVHAGGSGEMIAGERITSLPGSRALFGGNLHGYIAPTGPWCNAPAVPSVVTVSDPTPLKIEKSTFTLYPNPTTGRFVVEFSGDNPPNQGFVEIFDMKGKQIATQPIRGDRRHEFSISEKPVGLYLLRIITGDRTETIKIIKD
ncbi:MAG: T9SS type A sorting domain-containing protein [Bacteroidota bacterium]